MANHDGDKNNECDGLNRDASIETRSERFVDTSLEELLKSSNLNDLNCLYQGELVHERVAAIRKTIYNIRHNWSKYDEFMIQLKDFMENEAAKSVGKLSDEVKEIFSRRRNWADLEEINEKYASLQEEFNVIHCYTTKQGFNEIFKVLDSIFRSDSSVNFDKLITNAVFLVDLINIDLFNFIYKYPTYQNFEGVVYRGMAVPKEHISTFDTLLKQPVSKRYVSVPHSLWSTSLDLQQAVNFVKTQLDIYPTNMPLLMRIHVLNLDKDYLKFYQEKYQERSVVSTICAVNISDISQNKHEAEVLLRGAFFQALNMSKTSLSNIDVSVLDMVMLNTNRDHLSTPTLLGEKEDAEARALFGTMVGATRNRFIVDYCKKKGLLDDLQQYETLVQAGEERLAKLMSS